jgi:hypothetical protein
MKKKHYILTALALALTACANDDVVQTSDNDEIKFDVVTNSLSRAAEFHTTTDDLQDEDDAQFYISAYSNVGGYSAAYGYPPYIIKETLHYDGKNWIFTNNKKYVWPADALNFYAVHQCKGTDIEDVIMKYGSYGSKNEKFGTKWGSYYFSLEFGEVSVANRIDQQGDMLYAVRTGVSKGTDGIVTLNFRHALSAVNFEIYNNSYNLYVEVQNITINNIKNTGNFYINGSTYTQNTNTSQEYNSTTCKWMPIAGTQSYSLFVNRPNGTSDDEDSGDEGEDGEDVEEIIAEDGEDVEGEDEGSTAITMDNDSYECARPLAGAVTRPTNTQIFYNAKSQTFMLLPQSFDNDGDLVVTLRCRIYNINDMTKFKDEVKKIDDDSTSDAEKAAAIHNILKGKDADGKIDFSNACGSLLCGTAGTKQEDGTYTDDGFANLDISVPATKWVPGNQYIYSLVFGGAGGSALVPIKIEESVTDWDTTSEIDKEFKYEEAN